MVEKYSDSVNIRINPLNGAVVASPSPTEEVSYVRVYEHSKTRQLKIQAMSHHDNLNL